MPVRTWLKRLWKSERGNVFVLGAAALPLLVGSAGFAVDSIQAALWKKQLQRAADSAAIAGAYAWAQESDQEDAVANDLDEHIEFDLDMSEKPILQETLINSGSYAQGAISTESCSDRAVLPCFGRAVEVRLTAQRTLPFMSLFTRNATTLRAEGVAALVSEGEFCMISLYDGEEIGIDNNGNAEVILNCGMSTNSRSRSAVRSGGTSRIKAKPIAAVGGIDGRAENLDGSSELQPYSAPQSDPLSSLPNPDTSAMDCSGKIDVKPQGAASPLTPGCYSSISISGPATLQPGTYYVHGGDLDLGAQANVTGTGVTIVMTGPNGTAGDVKINGQATLNLTAPGSGTYKGVLMVRDRRAANLEIKINGGAQSKLQGALYMPSSDISYGGNAGMNVACLQMVARKLKFRGGANITNQCPDDGSGSPFSKYVVRLVG